MKIRKFGQLSAKKIQKLENQKIKIDLNNWEEDEFDAYPRKHANNQKFKGLDELQEDSE